MGRLAPVVREGISVRRAAVSVICSVARPVQVVNILSWWRSRSSLLTGRSTLRRYWPLKQAVQ